MQEITNKRNWDSKLFDTGRVDEKERPIYGTYLQNGLHDIEPGGSFVECNPSMRDYIGHVSTLESIRGRYGHLRAGDTGSESKDRVKILTKRDCGISLKLCGHKTYGPWDDTTRKIRFDTNDGITLNYYPSYKGVNIVITINNPQATSNVITFSLKKYGCDYTYEEKDGNIIAKSSTGEDDIYINALYATDANGDSGRVFFRKGDIVDGYQRIEKVIEPVWFGNATGPVSIDPSVTIDDDSGTIWDAQINSHASNVDKNFGGRDRFNTNNFGGAGDRNNVLMYVDLSAYSNITINEARFGIDIYQLTGSSYTSDAHNVLVSWVEGSSDGFLEVGACCWNWREYNTVAWNTAGCQGSGTDFKATKESSITVTGVDSDKHIDLTTNTVQGWVATPTTNYGIVLRTPTGGASSFWQARSSEAVAGNKPYFYMEWTDVEAITSAIAFSIYDKQFNAFKELSGRNTII